MAYISILFFLEIRSKMADWWPFRYLNMSPTISQTCMVDFIQTLYNILSHIPTFQILGAITLILIAASEVPNPLLQGWVIFVAALFCICSFLQFILYVTRVPESIAEDWLLKVSDVLCYLFSFGVIINVSDSSIDHRGYWHYWGVLLGCVHRVCWQQLPTLCERHHAIFNIDQKSMLAESLFHRWRKRETNE
uniref:Uncharacterized protein n=1 Tax=Eptatretus burgeri TaxID=7764 RepID=A0A8C4WVX4_EPTBU